MRMSADEEDPGYAAWRAVGDQRWSVDVFVDGDLVVAPVTADEERGILAGFFVAWLIP